MSFIFKYKKKTLGLFTLNINTKFFFIFNFFLFLIFIFDIAKADTNNSSNSNNNKLEIEYLESRNELEDYIVDTGDSLLIEFKNKPRGIGLIDWEYDPESPSYLNPRNDLSNYKLDEGDVLDIKFIYIPQFNSTQRIDTEDENLGLTNFRQYPIDQEGEIYLPELGSVYVKGLNIYQAKDLLEKKYEKYLKFTDMEIRINQFRFIDSGIYSINNEGELVLPLLKETYVRGLTTSEISNLLSKKYLNAENISTEVEIRIASFKPQRILVSGEIRNPGIYRFPAYSLGDFISEENIKGDKSQNQEIDGDNIAIGELNRSESNASLNIYNQNNIKRQNFQIKRSSENFTTISNAIRKAGGITSKTDLSRIKITRDLPIGKGGGKQRAIIDFTSFINENDPTNDIRLFDGDRIFLPSLASSSSDIIPKSILSGLSPRFITVDIFGRVENPGTVKLPLEAALSDAISLTGPIKPLSGKIVLIRYNKDGTILNKNISYSARAKKGSKNNPFVEQGDLITVKNSLLGKSTGVIREFTAPFVGIYSTKEIIEGFSN